MLSLLTASIYHLRFIQWIFYEKYPQQFPTFQHSQSALVLMLFQLSKKKLFQLNPLRNNWKILLTIMYFPCRKRHSQECESQIKNSISLWVEVFILFTVFFSPSLDKIEMGVKSSLFFPENLDCLARKGSVESNTIPS